MRCKKLGNMRENSFVPAVKIRTIGGGKLHF